VTIVTAGESLRSGGAGDRYFGGGRAAFSSRKIVREAWEGNCLSGIGRNCHRDWTRTNRKRGILVGIAGQAR